MKQCIYYLTLFFLLLLLLLLTEECNASNLRNLGRKKKIRKKRKNNNNISFKGGNILRGVPSEGDLAPYGKLDVLLPVNKIRFTKVQFPEGVKFPATLLPLTCKDFPIKGGTADLLKESNCPSVVTSDDYECRGQDVMELIELVGGLPPQPTSDPHGLFWDEFSEVVDVQLRRRYRENPWKVMPLPEIWKGYSIAEVAEAVHDEFPGVYHINLMSDFLKQGVTLDHTVIPRRSHKDFLRGPVMMGALNSWSIGVVGPLNFAAKYTAGVARPEEIAFRIAKGLLTYQDGVPQEIIDKIQSLGIKKPQDFTAYPEGAPSHPSWPAMHSAASSGSLWLPVVFNLTPRQRCQTQLLDFAIAYARTVAGVHYPMDNIAGLNLGQEIVARKLPEHISTVYGTAEEAVERKVAEMRFDWRTFDPWDCVMA